MNSPSSTYWQEQQLMDAMIKGVRHKAKTMTSSMDGELGGSLSPTARAGSVSSDASHNDRVRSWLEVRPVSQLPPPARPQPAALPVRARAAAAEPALPTCRRCSGIELLRSAAAHPSYKSPPP